MLIAEIKPDYAIATAQAPEPALPKNGALLRVSGCGLCGSDLEKFLLKKAPPGSVLGHEVTGVIETLDNRQADGSAVADNNIDGFNVGDRIVTAHHVPCGECHYCCNGSESMCRQFKATNLLPGGFAERLALSSGHLKHTAFKIPDHISDAEASCMEPLACVLKAVRRSTQNRHRHEGVVVITGLGFIGLLSAQVYQQLGYTVRGLDLNPNRLALAKTQGWVDEEVSETPAQADIVFLTVTTPATVTQALSLVRDGGTLVLFAGGNAAVDMNELYFREISVVPSYSPALEDLREAARLVFEGRINVKPLLSHTLPLREINRAFELYRSGEALKVFITC